MPKTDYHLILLCFLVTMFQSSLPHRRILEGSEISTDVPFMVYFLKADTSPVHYVAWTCGGAIIASQYILTSAACVQDVEHIYAIAGYKKYVSDQEMESDECIINTRKKVILTCVPKNYRLDYNKTEVWSSEDIAVVKVESPYDFTDNIYEKLCSYIPKPIEFNVEKTFPKAGDDAIVYGWGSSRIYRNEEDRADLNSEILHFASVKVQEESECIQHFSENPKIQDLIQKSMLCTFERGNLNDKGELIARTFPGRGCVNPEALRGMLGPAVLGAPCIEEVPREIYDQPTLVEDAEIRYDDVDYSVKLPNDNDRRRNNGERRQDNPDFKDDHKDEISKEREIPPGGTLPVLNDDEDRPGICQNDHGGPLVTWRGGKVVVVAVATLFKQNNKRECRGPFLFTKTWCNGVFLNCILYQEKQNSSGTRRRCDEPETVGFEIIRRHISWVGHKDGPAENERIQIRHQVPISAFQP